MTQVWDYQKDLKQLFQPCFMTLGQSLLKWTKRQKVVNKEREPLKKKQMESLELKIAIREI